MAKRVPKTSRKERQFQWNESREEAALFVAQDDLTDEQIANRVGVSRRTLTDWKGVPAFAARVESHVEEVRKRIRSRGIAVMENRIRSLQRRHDLMNVVITERAADPKMRDVPGGKTGLMVHNVKSVGSGETAERVDLYEVDTGLLKELREHEKQAAQELGQWLEKHEHSGEVKFHPITLDGDQEAATAEPPAAASDASSDDDAMGSGS